MNAVFIDRDGVINKEVEHLRDASQLVLLPNVGKAIKRINSLNIPVIIVTNQSAVARGFITEDQLHIIHKSLLELLATTGAVIDRIYYCPHHPEIGSPYYKMQCTCRKPNHGMLLKAAKEFNIKLNNSILIGDSISDMKAAWSAGCKSILVSTGHGQKTKLLLEHEENTPDYIANDLSDAIDWFIATQVRKDY